MVSLTGFHRTKFTFLNLLFSIFLCLLFLHTFISAIPVKNKKEKHISPSRFADEEFDKLNNESINDINNNDHYKEVGNENIAEELGIEYNRYLNEVVEALESDPEFRKKLENASEADIRSGKIAQELEYVNHQVRSKLDELKRTELDRLRELAKRQYELSEGRAVPEAPGHIDHNNPHSFEINDLHKLIVQVTNDLAEADRKRRELFKEYELQKRYERDQKLSLMTDQEKEEFLKKEAEEIQSRKKNMEKADIHHPGSKKQLEEVWQEQDHMGNTEFNPKAFFAMHDVDGNHMWDEEEVKMLFLKELDKMYKEGMPQNDLMERAEEMERMREHVFKEADTNRDRLISWDEFLEMTRRQEFNQDPGWKPIDQQQVYSQAEIEAFERQRQMEVDRLVREGRIPSIPPQYAHYGHPQPQYHPGQPIPQHPNMPQHVPAQHYNPGVNGMQYVPGNVPPVQVDPYHYQKMHENHPQPNEIHAEIQKGNIQSAPPQQQQVQYANQGNQHVNYQVNQQGQFNNQIPNGHPNTGQANNAQHNVNNQGGQYANAIPGNNQNYPNQGLHHKNQGTNQNQGLNQAQNSGQVNNQNQGINQNIQQGLNQAQGNLNQNQGYSQGPNQNNQGFNQNNQGLNQNQNNQALNQNNQGLNQNNQGLNQNNQGLNQNNQGINQNNQGLNQNQNNQALNQNNQGLNQNNQGLNQNNQGLNQNNQGINQNNQGLNQNNQGLNQAQNSYQNSGQINQQQIKDPNSIPLIQNNIGQGQAHVKEIPLH